MKRLIGIALLLVLCLLAWHVYSLSLDRKRAGVAARAALRQATVAAASAPPNASAATPVGERGIGFGLTFARVDGDAASGTAQLNCNGEPRELARPHLGMCNPHSGDTSCRTVLPVACFQPGSGSVGATQPTMGALLKSADAGTLRCAAELGAGWRMAELHDGPGSAITGAPGAGLAGSTRYWVHINDQAGNCWDSPP